MIPVFAVLYSLAGPLFWRDAATDCEAAIEQLGADVAQFAPDTPLMLVQWDCDEAKRADVENFLSAIDEDDDVQTLFVGLA